MLPAGLVGHSVPHQRTWDRMSHELGFPAVNSWAFPSTYAFAFTGVTCVSMTFRMTTRGEAWDGVQAGFKLRYTFPGALGRTESSG